MNAILLLATLLTLYLTIGVSVQELLADSYPVEI